MRTQISFFNVLILSCLGWFLSTQTIFANMPVFDAANLLESLKQTTYQFELYKQQIEEYKALMKNTESLSSYNWDVANETITNLLNATDTINYYKQQAGSMDAYLNRYQSEAYYRQSPCFNGYCTEQQMQDLRNNQIEASVAQKRANDAMLRGLDKQQQTLELEANKLKILQQQAENAEGQKQAIQAASQLASAQTNQLLQIRGLLVAQQTAEATRAAALANKESIQAVGDERFRAGHFKKSLSKTW